MGIQHKDNHQKQKNVLRKSKSLYSLYLSAPVIPDKNLGTADSRLSKVVTAEPAIGNFTSNRPPSPPKPNAKANTASPLSRSKEAQV